MKTLGLLIALLAPAEALTTSTEAVEPEAPAVEPEAPAVEPEPLADGLRVGAFDKQRYWVGNTWPVRTICYLNEARAACLVLHADVATGYRYQALGGAQFNDFFLERAELGTSAYWRANQWIDVGMRVQIEAIRSAGSQSLVGIDGNSLVMRLVEAQGNLAVHVGPIDLGARMGVVPERWTEQLHKSYDTRGLGPSPSDRPSFYPRSDLGATLTASGWDGRVEVDVEVVNGEGQMQPELNPGKNTTAIVTARPIMRRHAKGPVNLSLHGAYRDGSIGLSSGRNHRGSAAIGLQSPWAFAGFEYTHALGFEGRPDAQARTLGAWASGHAWAPWVGLLGQYERTQQDLDRAGSTIDRVTAGVFSDVFGYLYRNRRRIRLYAAYQYDAYGDAAGPLVGTPGALDTHRFLLVVHARGSLRPL